MHVDNFPIKLRVVSASDITGVTGHAGQQHHQQCNQVKSSQVAGSW